MAKQIYQQIDIKGHPDLPIACVDLHQSIFGHHEFSIELNDKYNQNNSKQFETAAKAIGSTVLFTFETPFYSGESSKFEGVITKAGIKESHDSTCTVVLSGHSASILLDGLKNTQTFFKKSLKDIFKDLLGEQPSNLLKRKDNSNKSKKSDFNFQFNESDFNFLARQAEEEGEWFFYDGESLQLGLPSGKKHKLKIGADVLNVELKMDSAPLKQTVSGYDYSQSKVEKKDLDGLSSPKDYLSDAKKYSNSLYSSKALAPLMSSGESGIYPSDSAKNMANLTIGKLVTITGDSTFPGMQVGDTIEVFTGKDTYGTFTVIELIHRLDNKGYKNKFLAIPASVDSPPHNPTISRPQIHSMTAEIIDNADPDKLGRVKVQFTWTKDKLETDWIRVAYSSAGKDYGVYFAPEIDDEVIVNFEFGNPDMPYVSGAVFHSKSKPTSLFDDKNYVKVIQTKGGNVIRLFDEAGKEQIEISTPQKKHTIVLDAEKKQITIETAGDLQIMATNINIKASKNLDIACDEFTLKANKKASIESMEIKAKADTKVAVEGGTEVSIKASAKLGLEGSAMTEVKGGMVKIN